MSKAQSCRNSYEIFYQVIIIDVTSLLLLLITFLNKHFSFSAIMDCLVLPLQEKLEDWKKSLINLDKEHAKGQ